MGRMISEMPGSCCADRRGRRLKVSPARGMSATKEVLERVAGIEPAYSAWKAAALPLSYTRPVVRRRAEGNSPAKAFLASPLRRDSLAG